MTMSRGQCLCGAVRFEGRYTPKTLSVCHCRMCRQWTGSALVGVTFKRGDVTWHGTDAIAETQSSSWAKRGWCKQCGSGLFFQFTAEGKWADEIELPIGLFDDPSGFRLSSEIYIDEKPDGYAFEDCGQKRLTRAEVVEALPLLESEA